MALRFPVRVGELSYQNTLPFRLDGRWNNLPCPSPRQLAQWAEKGRIDAGPIPVVEGWRLENDFEPLGNFVIAARKKAMSVLLFSRRPWNKLEGATIGVTDHTSTSVELLRLLLETRDGMKVQYRTGFTKDDDAQLFIGDAALTPPWRFTEQFPQVTDLAEEWHRWQNAPFVFARWMVRRSIPPYWQGELAEALSGALEEFERNRANQCRQSARALGVPVSKMVQYFESLVFEAGEAEIRAEGLFRNLVVEMKRGIAC